MNEPESKRETYTALAQSIIRDLSIEDGAAMIAQQVEVETADLRARLHRLTTELVARNALIDELYSRASRLDAVASQLANMTDGLACLANPLSEDRRQFDEKHGIARPKEEET